MDAQQAIRAWYLKHAGLGDNSPYGGVISYRRTEEFREHIKDCDVTFSREPEFDYVTIWGGTFNPDHKVSVLETYISCACGRYKEPMYLESSDLTLSDIIIGVIAAGEEES